MDPLTVFPVIVGNSQGQCSTVRPSFGIQGKGGGTTVHDRWQDGKQQKHFSVEIEGVEVLEF